MKKNTLPKTVAIATLLCLVLAVASIVDIKLNNSNTELFYIVMGIFCPIATVVTIKMWNYIK